MNDNLCEVCEPNFNLARVKAYELLLMQKDAFIGMRPEKITVPNKTFIFDSFQNYSNLTNIKLSELNANGKIKLGLHVNLNDDVYLILHNEEINSSRCKDWTKIHEIGHIYLKHEIDTDKEEIETNFFASCFTMPDVIIKYFRSQGYTVDHDFLTRYFYVSDEAATKKIETLSKYVYIPRTKYDNQVINLLHDSIHEIMDRIDNPSLDLRYVY